MANFLIISASSSMGQATAKTLQDQGHQIFTTARNNDKITADANLDATDFAAVDQLFEQAQQKLGNIDGVVNFSGSLLLTPADKTSEKQYQETIDASVKTAFATVRSAGKYLKDASIVLIASAVATTGIPNHEAIAAAKGGVAALSRSAAATYANKNLRFNSVAPGLVETNLTERIVQNQSALDYSLKMHPLHRVGTPQDIANAVAFLLDPKNSWITGQILGVDGGLASAKTI